MAKWTTWLNRNQFSRGKIWSVEKYEYYLNIYMALGHFAEINYDNYAKSCPKLVQQS